MYTAFTQNIFLYYFIAFHLRVILHQSEEYFQKKFALTFTTEGV